MVVDDGCEGVLRGQLLLRHPFVEVLALHLLGQRLDDDLRVGDLVAVQLDEREKAALGAELGVVVHVLQGK